MSVNPGQCASCGASGDMHLHHLVPQVHGGKALPTVFLCVPCHAAVHDLKYSVQHKTLTKVGLAVAKAAGRHGGNPALKSRDPEGLKRLQDARDARNLRELRAASGVWLPVVRTMRPQCPWSEVAKVLNREHAGRWTVERLRRAVRRMVESGDAEPCLIGRAPWKYSEDHLIRLVVGIKEAEPNSSLSKIAARLEAIGQPTARGGTRWYPSSVKHLLDSYMPLTERQ